MTQRLQQRLDSLKAQTLTRSLITPVGIDFSSNDYLGFAQDPVLRQRFHQRLQQTNSHGAMASRLLRGNLELYEETEQMLADFVQREAALLFSSGYSANVGLFSALLQPGDLVFSDEFNHASIIDGIRLSGAEKIIYPHLDYDFLESQLKAQQSSSGLKIIATESVFSMEGTMVDLTTLAQLAQRYGALLIVDEAHSTALYGASMVATLGLTEQVFASVHPAGKALGAAGAWVAGSKLLKEYLVNFARSFIFSTAPMPALPLLLQEAIKYYQAVGVERAMAVRQRAQYLRMLLPAQQNEQSDTPIIVMMVGDNDRALTMAHYLQAQLWDVRAIRPPSVPVGTARLRITVKWANTLEQLQEFARVVGGWKEIRKI